MKTSEALLYAIGKAGGEVVHYQFDTWIGQLVAAGFLEIEKRGEGDSCKVYYVLTVKAKTLLKKRGV